MIHPLLYVARLALVGVFFFVCFLLGTAEPPPSEPVATGSVPESEFEMSLGMEGVLALERVWKREQAPSTAETAPPVEQAALLASRED